MFFPYQKRWLEDQSRFKVGMFSRQSGKSFVNSFGIVKEAIDAQLHGHKSDWVILSRGRRQAKEVIGHVKKFCRLIEAGFRERSPRFTLNGTYFAEEVILPGGTITAIPANPDTARGYSRNVFMDEFAFHKDSYEIWGSVYPIASVNKKICVVSTPNGLNNKFYDLITKGDSENIWTKHVVNVYDAVEDGLPMDVDELRAGIDDEELWQQEYELKFVNVEGAFLPDAWVNQAMQLTPPKYANGKCYVGIDVAIRQDLFSITVIEEIAEGFQLVDNVTAQNAGWDRHDELLADVLKRYKIEKVTVDQTGLGEKPVHDWIKKYGSRIMQGIVMDTKTKYGLFTGGRKFFEDGKIIIPMDRKLRSDLLSLQRTRNSFGNVSIVSTRTRAGNCDRAVSLFLALHGAKTHGKIEYTPVKIGRTGFSL